MQGEGNDGKRQAARRFPQPAQCDAACGVDVVLDCLDFGHGWERAERASRGSRNDGGGGKCMVKQALVGPPRLDASSPRKREVAVTRDFPVDLNRFRKLAGKIGRGDVERAARHCEQHLAPSERRQPLAECRHLIDQRPLRFGFGRGGATDKRRT